MLFLLLACSSDDPTGPITDTATDAPCQHAVVTDIDETLTTSDQEWIQQLLDADHDPAERPDAASLMQGYADLGYRVRYVTARGADTAEGQARQLTVAWLEAHGFPLVDPDVDVVLADGLGSFGSGRVEYKTEVMETWTDEGWIFDHAYGNALSDAEAFGTVVPDEQVFLVGDNAGTEPWSGLTDEQAYTEHLPFLDTVPTACE